MPAQRKSTAEHRANGTFRRSRHAQEPARTPLDPRPPKHLDAGQRAAWREIVAMGGGLLAQSDRLAVELAARLTVRMRADDALPASTIAQFAALLHRLGLTSAGRRSIDRVRDSQDDGDDFSDF